MISVRRVARQRGEKRPIELIEAGKSSFVPGTPKGQALKSIWTGFRDERPPLEQELARRDFLFLAVPALALVVAWYLLRRVRRANRYSADRPRLLRRR
jgi:hypothetical protein